MYNNSLNKKNIIYIKFKNGLDIASKSFNILLKNKKLLLYFGLPLIIFAIIETLTYNIQKCSISGCITPLLQDLPDNIEIILKKFGTSTSWLKFTSIIFVYLTHITTITIAKMAITFHTNNIQKNNNLDFNCALSLFKQKIKSGIMWTTFILLPIATFTIISSYSQKDTTPFIHLFYTTIIFSISIAWSLVTAFVIQAITIEDLSIFMSIKKSILTIRAIFFEYLGAMFWVALIGGISSLPFIFLDQFINKATYNYITIIIILVIYCIITSAYEVSKTLLYNNFKQRNL